MKAEHRRELETNTLADSVGRLITGAKTGPSRNTLYLLVLVVVVLVAALGWSFVSGNLRQKTSDLWRQVDDNGRALGAAEDMTRAEAILKDIDRAASENTGGLASRALRFQEARVRSRLGLERLYSGERKTAQEHLQRASELYEDLSRRTQDSPLLRQEALVMSGKLRETQGQVEDALVRYKDAERVDKNSPLGKEAAERVKFLEVKENRIQVEDFYKEMNRLAEARTRPLDPINLDPNKPSGLPTLPEPPKPDNSVPVPLPPLPGASKPDEKKPDEKKPEEKKPDEKKSDEKKPEEKKPDEKKSEEKKPTSPGAKP